MNINLQQQIAEQEKKERVKQIDDKRKLDKNFLQIDFY